jgi:putative tryptophan/tyrosine transport system substrate-binding protein
MNKRRQTLAALGASALANVLPAALPAVAQAPKPSEKIWRVGFLAPRSRPASLDADFIGGFPVGMRERGYVEGKNLLIEWRFADGELARLPALAAELVQLKVDAIVASGPQAVRAAQQATTTIPIVMGIQG